MAIWPKLKGLSLQIIKQKQQQQQRKKKKKHDLNKAKWLSKEYPKLTLKFMVFAIYAKAKKKESTSLHPAL